MKVISFNSKILYPQEQKLSTLDRELLGVVHALKICEFLFNGFPHPIHSFTDHKPIYIVSQRKAVSAPDLIVLKCN